MTDYRNCPYYIPSALQEKMKKRLEIRCIVQDPLSPQLFRHMFKFFLSNYLAQGFVLFQFARIEKNTNSLAIMLQDRVIH